TTSDESNAFPSGRAPVAAEWRNKGYTLHHADTGRPIARLRPYGCADLMESLYWSLWRERWPAVGPLRLHPRSALRSLVHHRRRTNLLGWYVIQAGPKCAKVRPLAQSDRHDAPRLIDELVAGLATMVDELVV